MNGRMNIEYINEWTEEYMKEWTDEYMNEWTDEYMNKWTDEYMNEWTDEYTLLLTICNLSAMWSLFPEILFIDGRDPPNCAGKQNVRTC